MRKWFFLGVFCLTVFWLWHAYTTPSAASPSWTVQFRTVHGIGPGDIVEESGRRIGQVIAVEPSSTSGNSGSQVRITVAPDEQSRLREQSVFLVEKPPTSTRSVLNLVVLDEKSPMLPPGSRLTGVESELEVELKRQMAGLNSALRDMSQQLDQWRQTLDNVSKSPEKRELEEGIVGFLVTLQRTRDDLARIVQQEVERWKKLYEKIFPPEVEKTV